MLTLRPKGLQELFFYYGGIAKFPFSESALICEWVTMPDTVSNKKYFETSTNIWKCCHNSVVFYIVLCYDTLYIKIQSSRFFKLYYLTASFWADLFLPMFSCLWICDLGWDEGYSMHTTYLIEGPQYSIFLSIISRLWGCGFFFCFFFFFSSFFFPKTHLIHVPLKHEPYVIHLLSRTLKYCSHSSNTVS